MHAYPGAPILGMEQQSAKTYLTLRERNEGSREKRQKNHTCRRAKRHSRQEWTAEAIQPERLAKSAILLTGIGWIQWGYAQLTQGEFPMDPMPTTPFIPLNVAELVAHVGDVPGNRIRLSPAPGNATEADLLHACEVEKQLCELIDGTLVEKSMGAIESYLAMLLGRRLGDYVELHDLGILLGEAGMLRYSPRRIYIPDISFISWAQNPMREMQKQQVPDLHPDLAVEVLSPSNTHREMQKKRVDYFDWGTRLVWELDPATRTMQVFTAPETSTTVEPTGTLDGGEVLPGFTLPLAKLFENADRFVE